MLPGLPLLTAGEHCFARTFDNPCGPCGDKHSKWVLIGCETVREQNATDPTDWSLITVYHWAARKDGKPLHLNSDSAGARTCGPDHDPRLGREQVIASLVNDTEPITSSERDNRTEENDADLLGPE